MGLCGKCEVVKTGSRSGLLLGRLEEQFYHWSLLCAVSTCDYSCDLTAISILKDGAKTACV